MSIVSLILSIFASLGGSLSSFDEPAPPPPVVQQVDPGDDEPPVDEPPVDEPPVDYPEDPDAPGEDLESGPVPCEVDCPEAGHSGDPSMVPDDAAELLLGADPED